MWVFKGLNSVFDGSEWLNCGVGYIELCVLASGIEGGVLGKVEIACNGFFGVIFCSSSCMKDMILLYPFNCLACIEWCVREIFLDGIRRK